MSLTSCSSESQTHSHLHCARLEERSSDAINQNDVLYSWFGQSLLALCCEITKHNRKDKINKHYLQLYWENGMCIFLFTLNQHWMYLYILFRMTTFAEYSKMDNTGLITGKHYTHRTQYLELADEQMCWENEQLKRKRMQLVIPNW